MKRLLIVGAGGFGREVLEWAQDVDGTQRDWEIGGFLDANPAALDGFTCAYCTLGDPAAFTPTADDRLICAIGDPATKLRVCRDLKNRGGQFITLIHPTAIVSRHCHLGEGVILCPGAIVTTHARLDNFVTLNLYATVGHDAVIGAGCTLSPHVAVSGACTLGEGVFLGSQATVLPGATVGDYAVLGAGSVVLRRVRAHTTVIGVPARQVYGF
ncbi:MAG: acetyltransferase [Armatimonadota bacterium]|nr:acetyltransferase [Armatimonadota bacterium]